MSVNTSTPLPSPELFVMVGGIVIAIVVMVTCHLMKRCNRPKVPPPVQIEISKPPVSTQLFTITSLTTGSRLTEACSFRVLGGCRETSNVSEFYYSSKSTEGMRELRVVDFVRDHSGLTPVEEVSSEGSQDEASVYLELVEQSSDSRGEEESAGTKSRGGQDFTDTGHVPAAVLVSEYGLL